MDKIQDLITACSAVLAMRDELKGLQEEHEQITKERAELVSEVAAMKAKRATAERELNDALAALQVAEDKHAAVVGSIDMAKGDAAALAKQIAQQQQ